MREDDNTIEKFIKYHEDRLINELKTHDLFCMCFIENKKYKGKIKLGKIKKLNNVLARGEKDFDKYCKVIKIEYYKKKWYEFWKKESIKKATYECLEN